jgi:CheY-like chemotaxis protein
VKINSILVVEDNPSNQILIKQQLTILGYEVELVESGARALEELTPDRFDILMTDINMPDMDGYELTQKIRNQAGEQFAQIPIIAITANATYEDEQRCLSAGFDGFLAKPIDLEYLKKFLIDLQTVSAKTGSSYRHDISKPALPEIDIENSALGSDILDIRGVSDFVGGNRQMVHKLLHAFLRNTPEIIANIQTGQSESDANKVMQACHKLKSSARSVGAYRLADLCIAMETAAKKQMLDRVDEMATQLDPIFNETKTAIVNLVQK